MALLAWRLRRAGFAPYSISYPSVRCSFEENIQRLAAYAGRIEADQVHFVGHSLGGLVICGLFYLHPDQRPGRIVTLGTPHQGSHSVERLMQSRLGQAISSRSIRGIADGIPRQWPLPEREIGAIAGDIPLGLGLFLRGLPRPNDGAVAVAEALPDWATDRAVVHTTHAGLVVSGKAARLVEGFLVDGCF